MSKSDVKKYIKTLDKESLEELILDLYSVRKEVKNYLDYAIDPDDGAKLKEYKEIIYKEFYVKSKRGIAKMRFSVCRKAVGGFRSLDPSAELLADLMLCIPEYAVDVYDEWGYRESKLFGSTLKNFETAVKYIFANGLESQFESRIMKLIKSSAGSVYGLQSSMDYIYRQYVQMSKEKEQDEADECER